MAAKKFIGPCVAAWLFLTAGCLCAQNVSLNTNLTPREEQIIATAKFTAAPQFNGAQVIGVRPNTPLIYSLAVSGARPLEFSANKLPAGLTLDSKTGIILHAIREDELAVRAGGINTTRYKLLAFCLSGFFAGISGGLYAHIMRTVGPSTLEISMSFQVIIWSVVGGIVSIYGPVAGVFILFPLAEFLRVLPEIRLLIFAFLVLVILIKMPEGLIPWIRDRIEKECPRCKVRSVATRKTCRVCTASLD